ncbi:MAG: low molecular weight protein arginine phosphatase [Gemmatimonadota bacterium]
MTPKSAGKAESEPFRILFVCTGNTCRSPLAAAIADAALAERKWKHVEVRSAGIAAGEGLPASDGAVRVGRARGVDLSRHESTPLTEELVEWADLVLTMAPHHQHRVKQLGGGERATLLTAFAAGPDGPAMEQSVLDPIGGEDVVYDATFAELKELIHGVLARLEPILSP